MKLGLQLQEDRISPWQTRSVSTCYPIHYTVSYAGDKFIATCYSGSISSPGGPIAGSGEFDEFDAAIYWIEDHFEDMVLRYWGIEQ